MAEFFDVEGVPVSIGAADAPVHCAAWDVSPPRPFDPESARRNGAPVSEATFRALIERLAPKARSKSMHPPEVAARIADFNAKLGPALVESLRRATKE